jgi:REP element-mobilizing transposase RayT
MPTGYQIKDQYAAHYLTFQVVYWVDIFTKKQYRDIVIDSIKYCQQNKGLTIFAWVIMSNHIHLLSRSETGELSNTIRDFKKYTSKLIIETINNNNESRKEWMLRLFSHAAKRQNKKGEFQVWTHENHAMEISSNAFIAEKVEYIHNNPVRAGIVKNSFEYLYSSARNYADEEGFLEVELITIPLKTIK